MRKTPLRRAKQWAFNGVFLAGATLLLVACGPPKPMYQVLHDLTPPASEAGRLCAAQCLTVKQQCAQNTKLTQTLINDRCRLQEREEARKKFEAYVRGRKAKDAHVKKSENDFYNEFRCSSAGGASTNNCQSAFNQCYSTCGGKIVTRSVCVANSNVPWLRTAEQDRPEVAVARKQGWSFDEVFAASGSGSTHSDLLFGLHAAGSTVPVASICVRRAGEAQQHRIKTRCGDIAKWLRSRSSGH